MKFNNKLELVEYLELVSKIAEQFFDEETNEYTPQVGEIYAVCEYFNHCVELEDSDEIKTHPINDITEIQQLLDNEEFVENYTKAIWSSNSIASLQFGSAYDAAKDIVEYKKNDANSFATAIVVGLDAVLRSFKESFTEEEVTKIAEIAKEISSGKISNEAIVKAYENSDRFKENTEELKSDENKLTRVK